MFKKRLGRTGLQVPVVGLGTVFVGFETMEEAALPLGSAAPNRELGVNVVSGAFAHGASLVDTAPIYGAGETERIIGEAIRLLAPGVDRPIVGTKAGRPLVGRDFTSEGVRQSVYRSLERLGTDTIDYVCVHDASKESFPEVVGRHGALEGIRKLQDEGVVRHVGTAITDVDVALEYVQTGEFDVAIIGGWSLLRQTLQHGFFDAAEAHDVGLIAATPFERGLLATGPVKGRNFGRRQFSEEVLAHVNVLDAICRRHEVPIAAVALQWCTRHPLVSTVIPGARTIEEATANARYGQLDIPDALWAEIESNIVDWSGDIRVR